MNRRGALLVVLMAAVVLALAPGASAQAQAQPQAQTWPVRPVRFIVSLGPGSGVDISARLLADRLTARWNRTVVVENRPGADGVLAITTFITAHDDHTLLYSPTSAFTAHPYQHDKMPYDPRELGPIARVSNTILGVVVPPSLNIGSVAELIARIRQNPGKFNYSTATGMTDLMYDGYFKSAGLDITRVPYRDVVAPLTDLGEGRIQAYFGALAIVLPHVEAGRAKLIAVTGSQRAPTWPDVPTVAEAGFPALTFDGLTGLFGPRDMPANVRTRIAVDVNAAAAEPTVAARLIANGQLLNPGNPDEFAASIEEQRARLAAIAKELGIKAAQQ